MLAHFRNQIDCIDDQIIELLAKRFEVVKQVGIYKREHNLPPLQPARWQEVLDTVSEKAVIQGIDPVFITDIWNRIHKYALELEEK